MSNMKKRLIGALLAVVLLVSGIVYFYFLIFANSPKYSIQKIEYAVESHNKELFYEYVDVQGVLNNAYDSIVKSLMDSDATLDNEAKNTALETVRVLKSPIIFAFQKALDSYIESGSFDIVANNKGGKDVVLDTSEIISQAGLKNMEFRGVENIITQENNQAIALVKTYHTELEREFIFEVVLEENENKKWRVTAVRNFDEFVILIGNTRREKIRDYLTQSNAIWQEHENIMRDANFDFQRILGAKSLGKQGTRGELKNLMTEMATDWQVRREELETLNVPREVSALHKLRLRIIDLNIEYAEGYAAWLDDKNASTLRDAEEKIKQAKTLEQEANLLEKRIKIN